MTPARRQKAPTPEPAAPPRLIVPVDQLEAELADRVARGQELLGQSVNDLTTFNAQQDAYYNWSEYNKTLLERSFDSPQPASEYTSVGFGWPTDKPLQQRWEWLRGDIQKEIRRLSSLQERLNLYQVHPDVLARPRKLAGSPATGDDVFIVHGHDGETKVTVARFLEKLLSQQQPVILHEQADRGRTVIEKFEQHATQAACAVVLLTADDMGGAKSGAQQPRARQNVVLELGFFIGKLGRDRVIILYEPGVELPSDLQGVLYTELDPKGAWRTAVARELKAIGLAIDPQALLT